LWAHPGDCPVCDGQECEGPAMSMVPQKPFQPGQAITARRLREMQEARSRQVGGQGVSTMGGSELHSPVRGIGGAITIKAFRVTAVRADHLECAQIDGASVVSGTTKVGKPYLLRQTPFDGRTIDGITYTY